MSGVGGSYLKEVPTLPDGHVQRLNADNIYYVTGIPREVCKRINANLKVFPDPTEYKGNLRMFCYLPETNQGMFFANPR